MSADKKKVFISYAREDYETAKRLYHDLKQAGLEPWMDKIDLLPGHIWKTEVEKAIKKASYFITLISENSVSKERGFVHKEQRIALELFDELPSFKVYFIPVRIDSIRPEDERLPERVRDFHWAELYPDYEDGLSAILRAIAPQSEPPPRKPDTAESVKPVRNNGLSERLAQAALKSGGSVNIVMGDQTTVHAAGDVSYAKDSGKAVIVKTAPEKQTAEISEKPETDPKKITNSIGMVFACIPPGEFTMGSPENEPGRYSDESPQHRVILTKGFYMQTTEVTQGQWKAVMGNNPSYFKNCGDNCPVENVSWDDVQDFIEKLNEKEGKGMYRLPTEAEWEYSCRAGTTTALYSGNIEILGANNAPALDPIAWYGGNSGVDYEGGIDSSGWTEKQYQSKTSGTHPVETKQPNAYGLYDMIGNVWEWCQDWKGDYPTSAVTDPVGPSSGSYRVLRGGSWGSVALNCRSANRDGNSPGNRSLTLGFRPLRVRR